jgi:NAD+ synthase
MQAEKVIEHITKWLKDYQESSRTKGFVVGVSGGVDSAVVSTLCARTGLPTLVLEMPIRQSSNEVRRSHNHIDWLKNKFPNVTGAEVNLIDVFESFVSTVKKSEINEENSASEIAYANMRSRLRMVKIIILFSFLIYLNLIL